LAEKDSLLETIIFFTDGLVTVRPFQPEDAPEMYGAISESQNEVPRWLNDLKGVSLEAVQDYIASQPQIWNEDKAYNFAVVESKSNQIVGGCGLTQINRRHRYCNLYYWVRTSATGRGFATRAAVLMARFAFESLGMQRMEIVIEPDNLASLRVAEKAGAISEGYLRSRLFMQGEPRDAVIFSLVPEDLTQ
jgi:ribosomal-protein-serine acetyltransferase